MIQAGSYRGRVQLSIKTKTAGGGTREGRGNKTFLMNRSGPISTHDDGPALPKLTAIAIADCGRPACLSAKIQVDTVDSQTTYRGKPKEQKIESSCPTAPSHALRRVSGSSPYLIPLGRNPDVPLTHLRTWPPLRGAATGDAVKHLTLHRPARRCHRRIPRYRRHRGLLRR